MSAEPKVDLKLAREHGLSDAEYARVVEHLGRTPTFVELGVFSVMWSEHCSYKSSRIHLRDLPTEGARVLQGPGENAGVVDVGGGWAIAFKMESHNHPSYIEPYQGAATGVGGILRDVFTMGARPIANLNALRFGSADHPKTPHLLDGVVRGIGGYGNCIGVPTVGGDCAFDEAYDGNILVNAMTVGVLRADGIWRGNAAGPGNPVLYVGSKTGRDGIHGASLLASAEFDDETDQKRPTVQVGDPFTEKLLLEACLELMASDCLVGIQDMGAAGLTSSSVEMAARAGTGIELDLDRVPRRETGMTPYEIMLSESQERMLMVVTAGREAEAQRIFEKWDLDCAIVGRVTTTGRIVVRSEGAVVADMPIPPLAEGLRYERSAARPAWQDDVQRLDHASIRQPADLGAALLALLASPTIARKDWIWRQYDHTVRAGTVVAPGSDAAVVRLLDAGGRRGIAMTVDCNGRFCFLDPYEGARLAVAEAYRNISCVGGEPIAVTDCLNFGNPERPDVMWQFVEAVRGLGDACRALGTPVVSGNVSFYNETEGRAIHPTPMIGMIGLVDDVDRVATQGFKGQGDLVALLGACTEEVGGSEYVKVVHGRVAGSPPRLDLEREKSVSGACRELVRAGLLRSAHDCSEGGLAVALAESCLSNETPVGARVTLAGNLRPDALLFGEAPSRIVISFAPDRRAEVESIARAHAAPLEVIGATGGDALEITGVARVALAVASDAWRGALRRIVGDA
ncbi:MAG: phosphoribosylformylglycinamidine synthase subunit PurL [Myxococcota bacterium]